MTPAEFLPKAMIEAIASNHVFPAMAACEAALESAWGESGLAKHHNNLFGEKAPRDPAQWEGLGTVVLPTKEFVHHEWITVDATWLTFPTWQASFEFRMQTLHRLAATFPEYRLALKANSPEYYIGEVSQRWSTDPQRAAKVLQIYHAHQDLLMPPVALEPRPEAAQ